jgi:hypothetical protein
LKELDDATAEHVKSTQLAPNYADLNLLDCHVWNEVKKLVYRARGNLLIPLSKCNEEMKTCDFWYHKVISDQPSPNSQDSNKSSGRIINEMSIFNIQ